MSDGAVKRAGEHGFPGAVKISKTNAVSCLEAFTDLQTQEMTVRFNPDFVPNKKTQAYRNAKSVSDALETCVADAAGHECGHVHLKDGKSCPGNVDAHEQHFYNPIFDVLKAHGKEGATDAVANLAEDLIDNTLTKKHQSHAGLVLFYDDNAREKGWDKAFEAFMRVQTYCWGDPHDKKLLRHHYKNDTEVITATKNIVQRLSLQRNQSRAFLENRENWKKVATVIAEELSDLIQPPTTFPMCGHGKAMRDAMRDPTNRQKFAVRRYEAGKKRPNYMTQEEALDHVYTTLAKQIPLKVEAITRQSRFPVVPYQHEPFSPEEHALEDINWHKPVITGESPFGGHVNFGVAQHHYELPLHVKLSKKGFPSVKFGLVDCSSSMEEGIPRRDRSGNHAFVPWGDQSKYHYAVRAWYGITEHLARTGILPNVHVTAGVFSNTTRIGEGLSEAKKVLLNPSFGDTALDLAAVERVFAGPKSIFFTISDGDIQNWETVKDRFTQLAKQHHYFHLQIGPASTATQTLEQAGLPVYHVRTGEELERIAIDLTKQAYSQHAQNITAHLGGNQ